MKKQRKQKAEAVVTLRLWTLAGAMKVVPYLRSLVQSLRDKWLELRQTQEQLRRVESRPGRPDRDTLILVEESRRRVQRAEAGLEEVINEMLALSAFGIDPAAGLAALPFFQNEVLAWFVFDLFDPAGFVAWRLHSDPLETRRPMKELAEATPAVGSSETP